MVITFLYGTIDETYVFSILLQLGRFLMKRYSVGLLVIVASLNAGHKGEQPVSLVESEQLVESNQAIFEADREVEVILSQDLNTFCTCKDCPCRTQASYRSLMGRNRLDSMSLSDDVQ